MIYRVDYKNETEDGESHLSFDTCVPTDIGT